MLLRSAMAALLLLHSCLAGAETRVLRTDRAGLVRAFRDAAREFQVPVSLLHSIAYAETRWNHLLPQKPAAGAELEQEHPPGAYGIMGLRDDDWFGHSLSRAAGLIHQPESVV